MAKKRLLWQLFPSYLLITLISLTAATWYASNSLRQFYLERTAADLRARALLLEESVSKNLALTQYNKINSLCKKQGLKVMTRITVILPSGKVAGDSEEDPRLMNNHADRPEIKEALAGRIGTSIRFSHTQNREMMYTAIPVKREGGIAGVLRTSISLGSIDKALNAIYKKIALGGVAAALLAAIMSLAMSRRISHPLEDLKKGAERFAQGDLEHKLPVSGTREIGAVTEAMNLMAAQLDDRIRTIVRQRNEQEAVLSSMVEGVLAVDAQQHLISLNQAAARLIGVNPAEVRGRSILEIVRNTDLQRFVDKVLTSRETVEGEIVLYEQEELFLRAYGTVLRDAGGVGIGALVVLNDLTRLRKLENIRRDFVANVSHELKTPITSIKGFVETLLEGARHNPEDTERFLGIIATQADRLNAIIEDLLTLSRIEQEAGKAEIFLKNGSVKAVLEAAIGFCTVKAAARNIRIDLNCRDDIQTRINHPLLEQAVVNLIDNAVKYSEPENPVLVQAEQTDTEVIIEVGDHGCGIGKEHLPRLFERFYRVDKARSRKLGGTGLGLAIVKHIAQAHHGRVSVQSAPLEGSTFSIHLPAA